MRLYTKGGDDGTTALRGGARVPKDHPRVAAYGGVDETNAAIGVVVASCDDEQTVAILRRIQSDLFIVGAELATPAGGNIDPRIDDVHVARLEQWIDEACEEVPPASGFVLPGGTATAARLDVARTICRRAERAVVSLIERESVGHWTLAYINRLSDLLFALARRANHRAGMAEVPWVVRDG